MSDEALYVGREQTLVKHFILRKYLERFAHIIGFRWDAITYVDCFSGPWQSQSGELRDTSFAIALEELRKARSTHEARGKALRLRCMFLERDPDSFERLKEFANKAADVEIRTRNSELGEAVEEILAFVKAGGKRSFPFFFIDPTGWKGFGMGRIAPLLRCQPGEVLINFMTDYIRRFLDHPQQPTKEQFAELFGSAEVKALVEGLATPQDREDALFGAYAQNVKATGGFTHTCAAIILYPEVDRTYFHLIYATRDRKGVEVFKEVEKQAAKVMERSRAGAKQRRHFQKTGERGLFAAEDMPQSRPIDHLRERYLGRAQRQLRETLRTSGRLPYENAYDVALSLPLVWESDLKDWIKAWKAEGRLRIEGMQPRQQVPKLSENNVLVWQEPG